jgi:DNA-binding NtrC family response regulator
MTDAMARRAGKILVVDDEMLVRWSLCRHLESLGFTALEASSCEEALDVLQREGPVLLAITDLVMPGADGVELMSRAHDLDPRLPFLVVTGTSSREMIERARQAGAVQTIAKPFDLQDISRMVERFA